MENKKYLDELVRELMSDPEWQLPANLRFFLVADLEWGLLNL